MAVIWTPRLELVPMTLEMVEAVMLGDRARAEAAAHASLPPAWPNRDLIERAFTASLEAVRAEPDKRLWGDRLLVTREGVRRVVGSVVFHGRPDDGIAEVGYGVEESSQRMGLATEATLACVEWALSEPDIQAVQATTMPWHRASLRVIEKLGMHKVGEREHPLFGELFVFERRR
jgi:RimJ/RimL family protein N-acetyltransferase